jgi:hypothetical protein
MNGWLRSGQPEHCISLVILIDSRKGT